MEIDLMPNISSIILEDNNKKCTYKITKDETSNNYFISITTEKEIKSNDLVDENYKKIEEFFDSLNNSDYWPTANTEYPDYPILWSMTKTGKKTIRKDGALKYPEKWDEILEIINKI